MVQKVLVWAGDGKTYLGSGVYLGDESVHFFRFPDGHLVSMRDATIEPPDTLLKAMKNAGAEHISRPGNPKIQLDSGEIVYGCQVWWQRAKE